MTRHYPDLGSASDWLKQVSQAAWPIESTTQIWVVLLIGWIKCRKRHNQSEALYPDLSSGACFLKPLVAFNKLKWPNHKAGKNIET